MVEFREMGLRGFKLHSDMQLFALGELKAMRTFEAIEAAEMPVIIHTGDPRHEFSGQYQLRHVLEAVNQGFMAETRR